MRRLLYITLLFAFGGWTPYADAPAIHVGAETVVVGDPTATSGIPLSFELQVVDGNYPGNGRPGWSASGDINQDGLIDVVSGGGRAIQWYEAPSWTRRSIEIGSSVGGNGGVVMDVDGDGDLDVITAQYLSSLVWFENPGIATVTQPWTRRTIDGTNPLGYNHDLIAADVDGDSQDEIVALYVGSGGVAWYDIPANPAAGPWPRTSILSSVTDPYLGLASGDLDQDGDVDIIISNRWYENVVPTTPEWTSRQVFAEVVQNVTVYDVDQDGRNDVVGAQGFSSTGKVLWARGPAAVNDPWVTTVVASNLDGPENVWAGDIDGDGLTDIVTGEMGTSTGYGDSDSNLLAYRSVDATALLWDLETLASNVGVSARINPVDIDNDGDLDFLADGNGENHIYLWRSNLAPDTQDPVISAVQVNAGANDAIVSWVTSEPASSRVDYGLTSGHGSFVEDGALKTSHSLVLNLLDSETDYHFAITSVDGASNSASTADDVFTTTAAQTSISDDFSQAQLDPRWTFVDPLADGTTVSMTGTQVAIAVPATGAIHDVWTNSNDLPRLMQSVGNTDFEIEAKFESNLIDGGFVSQGIMVEQDPSNVLRIEFYRSGNKTRVFVAGLFAGTAQVYTNTVVSGSAPMYLRVKRTGNAWTVSRSFNGTSFVTATTFNKTMTVNAVGVYAGNDAATPHTAIVDYFFDTSSPIVPEDGGGGPPDTTPPVITAVQATPGTTQATVTWTTNEPSTSRVDYGLDNLYGSFVQDATLKTNHSLVLPGLDPETTYHYAVTSSDASANSSSSSDATFQTSAQASLFESDDFSQPALDPRWSFIDPLADGASFAMTGTQVAIIVPATGAIHDVWTNSNHLPRLMQSTDDADFVAEVKLESDFVTGGFQSQGIMVEQDPANVLRIEFYRSGSNTHVFVAGLFAGSAQIYKNSKVTGAQPMYLRVARAGNSWTVSYSFNGTSFTTAASFVKPMTVNAVGVYAGNDASTPHTAVVDYFFETASPIVPEDGGGGDVTAPVISAVQVTPGTTSATVTWTTDEPASSRVDFGLDNLYGDFEESPTLVTNHSVTLTGLDPETTYHFSVTSEDASTNSASSADDTFATTASAGLFASDDFTSGNLDGWTFIDPLDDGARLSMTGSQLAIVIPATGAIHDTWTNSNTVPRVMQTTSDIDFQAEAKFESDFVSSGFQSQGIMVEEDPSRVIRIEYYRSGTKTRVFVAGLFDNSATVHSNLQVVGTQPMYLRVTRVGDDWTVAYSFNGTGFTTAASFAQPMVVNAVGVYAGNDAATPHTALVDYFFDTSSPIVPEDGGGPDPDAVAPVISNVTVTPLASSATITWTTDEFATSSVAYGPSAAYELGSVTEPNRWTEHSITLVGLDPETTYHYQITSTDFLNNTSSTSDQTFVTPENIGGPIVDLWYGDQLTVGTPGQHQTWVNILGNVSDADGMQSLVYSLNGGPNLPLTLGPDTRRLADAGDFNVEIAFTSLNSGINNVVITATDVLDNVTVEYATIDYQTGNVWPLPYSVDWSTAAEIQDVSKVVDGLWTIDPAGLRTIQLGYDRVVAIGDVAWDDYELTVPITIHSIDSSGFVFPSNGAFVGLITRWPGHVDWTGEQPTHGWYPYGGVAGYTWNDDEEDNRFTLAANRAFLGADPLDRELVLGVTYMWKLRVETTPGPVALHSFKLWEASASEPAGWDITGYGDPADPESGSLLLLAHHVDATFGDVTVDPVGTPPSKVAAVQTSGNVSGDDHITSDDARMVFEHVSGITSLPDDLLAAADVSGNGTVTAFDGALIRQYVATKLACSSFDEECRNAGPLTDAESMAPRWSGHSRFGDVSAPSSGMLSWGQPTASKERIEIPLDVTGVEGSVTSLQVSIPIADNSVTVTDVESLLPQGWDVWYHQIGGELKIVMAGSSPLTDGSVAVLSLRRSDPTMSLQLAGHGFVNEGAALAIGQLDFAGIFSDWTLYPNYPNPFSDLTNLRYGMPEASRVVVDIYDVIGRRVAILVDEELPAGSHTVVWNGVDQAGRSVPSGMYFARLKAGSHVKVHRMMVVR